MADSTEMRAYYAQRAREYEAVYTKPERQADLASLRADLDRLLAGHDVLEVACGTGYWTETIARTARSVLATDVNDEVLAIAREKRYPAGTVRFQWADALTLDGVDGVFTAGFAGFWWSHLRKSEIGAFLRRFHATLGPGALVVAIDNRYVEGSSIPISRRDEEGNSYQQRRLANGRVFELLKNFPTEAELRACAAEQGEHVEIRSLTYFWRLRYQIAGG
jgi:demethylmenaquinone methyltransferase/2-methoxy-6-polyprenyl-1,4-benzoquinol methylase